MGSMSQEELIANTNDLLRQVIEINRKREEEHARSKVELEATFTASKQKREEALAAGLRAHGHPDEIAEGSDEDWEKRMAEAQSRARENMEASRKKAEEHKDALLEEMRTQSELLRKIAEKLGA